MSGVTLNDVVVEWGSHNGANAYNPAKDRLTAGMSQDEVAAFAGATNWNDGLRYLAQGPPVLQEAVLLLDASFSDAGEPRVINRGTGGTALDAKYGSVLGAYVYDGAAVLPGVASNYLSTPDAAALDIAGDMEVVARLSSVDYAQGNPQVIASKYNTSGGQKGWAFRFKAFTGLLQFYQSTIGTDDVLFESTVAPSVVDGETYWFKATFDVDNGSGGKTVRFYMAADQASEPSAWTQVGADVTIGGSTAATFNNTTALTLGMLGDGISTPLNGKYHRTIVRNGIDGTTVLDVDCANVPDYATSFTATTGQTVTVNSTSSDTNDPLLLTHTGENYVYLPGASGNSFSSTSALVPQINGDLEIVARVAAYNWTTASQQGIISRDNGDPNRAFLFAVAATTGALRLRWYPTGSAASSIIKDSTIAPPFVDGRAYWVKATLDVDNGASGNTVRFYYAADQNTEPTSWTQLGSDVVTAGVTSLPTVTANPVSGEGAGGLMAGKMYRLILRDGIDGPAVWDVDTATDITDAGATSFTATSGQTVTVNRATSGRKTALVTRPIWLFGTDDYLEVADNALVEVGTDDFTALVVVRTFGTAANPVVFSKASGDGPTMTGWTIQQNSTGLQSNRVGDGVTRLTPGDGGAWASGDLHVNALVRGGGNFTSHFDGTTPVAVTDTIGSLDHVSTLKVGAIGTTAQFLAGEVVAAALWRRALTTDEIAAINTYYSTGA